MWDNGIETAELSWGKGLTAIGRIADEVELTIEAVMPGTSFLVWAASGEQILPLQDKVSSKVAGPHVVTVPVCDQDGWYDDQGNAYKGWTYRASVRYLVRSSNKSTTITRAFQVQSGVPTIDLDVVPEDEDSDPVIRLIPGVRTVNGVPADAFGNVQLADLEGVSQQDLADHVNADEPHPAYDNMPDLRTYFRNALI